MTTPHEPGLGRRIKALERDGFFVGDRNNSYWWWESEFGPYGTQFDVPFGAEGPFPSYIAALTAAERFHEANPA